MKFKALAYQGVYWLKDLGDFDTHTEAADALQEQHDKYCADDEIDSEDYNANSEVFWFDSRIEEI